MSLDTTPAHMSSHALRLLCTAAIAALTLAACGTGDSAAENGSNDDAEAASADDHGEGGTVTVEDDHGTHEIAAEEIESVGAFDNRTFRTLEDLGVELTVAPRALMREGVQGYAEDEDILDTGNHREPDLELIVAAEPDLVITGQRYGDYYDEMVSLVPEDSVILQFDEALATENFFSGLVEHTEALGTVFDAEDQAQELIDALADSMERVQTAYDGQSSVMGLVTSGGDINYAGPQSGRGVSPVFQEFGLVPALEVEDESSDHEGDDISVEAIADSNPDWIIVLDRDGMNPEDPEYTSAQELIAESPALQQVTAVEEDQIVYMPQHMYLTEDIQAYTEFLNDFADALESAQ